MDVNDPELVARLTALHDDYEKALAANDVDALTAFFWDSSHVVRFGIAEQLYGTDELRAYRQGHTPPYTDRRIVRRSVCVFGAAFAVVMSEIEIIVNGAPKRNRQSQTWVDFPDLGWRIVAAHVSVPFFSPAAGQPWAVYADAMAQALGLAVAAEHRPGVVANLQRTAAIVAPLLGVTLSDDVEPASVFTA